MNLLLTSAGIKNASIESALVELLGKPIAESHALCIPTAMHGHPGVPPGQTRRFITGEADDMCGLGWKGIDVLELTALPSLDEEDWLPEVREADVLLAAGGDATYLAHWMRESRLADLLPALDAVWVGMSAGSMALTPRIGSDFVAWSKSPGDRTLGLVDFSIFPHLDHPLCPQNTMPAAERWAAEIGVPAYVIDDDTAIRVVDGAVDVVSEGTWRQLA